MWKSLSRTTGCSAIAWPRTSADDSPARPWAALRPSRRASASPIRRAKIAKPFSALEQAFSMTAFRCSRRILPGIRHAPNTSARSFVTSAGMDRALWTGAVLRLGYVHTTTRDLFVISPVGGDGGVPGVLGLLNTGKENYSQAEATLRFHPIKDGDLNIFYIWSR